jgi:hypothetical protein
MSRIIQFFLILFATAAYATEFVPSSLPSQVAQVPIIVRGTIGSHYSDWGNRDDGGRGLYTFYQLQPSEVMKGQVASGASILFREIGGEKDGVGAVIPGAAQFTQSEDVVVMLGSQNNDGSYDLIGLSAGKFNITRQEDGSEGLTSAALSPPPHDGKWTIADLKKAVHDQAATPQAKSPASNSAAVPVSTLSKPPKPAAPQLQTSEAEPSGAKGHDSVFFRAMIVLGLILIGLIALKIRKGGQSEK